MTLHSAVLIAAALGAAMSPLNAWACAEPDEVVELINRLGGTFIRDSEQTGQPIIEVNLFRSEIDADGVRQLAQLTRLRKLSLRGCKGLGDDGISAVGGLTSLRSLDVRGVSPATDAAFKALGNLTNLVELHIGLNGPEVTGAGLVHLRPLTRLQVLTLSPIRNLQDQHLEHLAALPNLEVLVLSHSRALSDVGMEHVGKLRRLKSLEIQNTKISDAGLQKLMQLERLESINVTDTRVTPAGFDSLKQALNLPQQGMTKVFGVAALTAHTPGVDDAVGLRYKCRVLQNRCRNAPMWKIIFMFHTIHAPGRETTFSLQNQFGIGWHEQPHMSVNQAPVKVHHGEAAFSTGSIDWRHEHNIGANIASPGLFHCADFEVDFIKDLWMRSFQAQANMNNKTIAFELARGGIRRDRLDGWSVHGELPKGDYRIWTATSTIEGNAHVMEFAYPAEDARYLMQPLVNYGTEAFFHHPGLFAAVFWDIEYRQESSNQWKPITSWKLDSTDAEANTWGMKRSTYDGKAAIEISNDGSATYLKRNERLELK